MADISMNVFPNQSFPNLRSHLVLSDMSNICLSVRSAVFTMELRLFWKFFPMNVADSIVTAINIPQIIEYSSPSPATLEIPFSVFFALDHSPDSRMILILRTIPILFHRCP